MTLPSAVPRADASDLDDILKTYDGRRGGLIAVLEAVQARYGYLPEEVLRAVSERTGCSLVDIYGVATFYRSFSLKPRGEHLICACLGTACHVRGASGIVSEFERQLGIPAGETTPDGKFTLETVNCLGACALGPVVVIDGRYFSKVRASRVRQLLDGALEGFETDGDGPRQRLLVKASCSRCNHNLMDAGFEIDGHPSIRLSVMVDHRHGWHRLSALHGSGSFASEIDLAGGAVARFFCPHCHAELAAGAACPSCEAPLAPLIVEGGGMLRICSRRGCDRHLLDLT